MLEGGSQDQCTRGRGSRAATGPKGDAAWQKPEMGRGGRHEQRREQDATPLPLSGCLLGSGHEWSRWRCPCPLCPHTHHLYQVLHTRMHSQSSLRVR